MWLVAADAVTQGAGFIKLALVGRVLGPADFGLVGIALVVQRMIESFTDTGVMSALIQKRGDVRPYLDSAWTLQALRGVLVCLVLVLAAPLGRSFFGSPEAVPVIRCIGLSTLLWGLVNPAVVYLRRDLRFHADVTWRAWGVIVSLAIVIPAAYWLRNAWALILALIAGRIGEVIASYRIDPYRPKVRLCWKEMRELMDFGRWVSFSNMAAFVEKQIDSLAVGRFFGPAQLGYYQVATQFASPFSRLGAHVQGVMFPAISQLEDEAGRRRAFICALEALSAVVIPFALFTATMAQPLIALVLGPKWAAVAPLFQALACASVASAVSSGAAPLLMGIGQPRRVVETQALKIVALVALIIPCALQHNLVAIAWAVAASSVIAAIAQIVLAIRAVRVSLRELLGWLKPAFCGSAPLVVTSVIAPRPLTTTGVVMLCASLAAYVFVLRRVFSKLLQHSPLQGAGWWGNSVETADGG